jgi:hypothetical protein
MFDADNLFASVFRKTSQILYVKESLRENNFYGLKRKKTKGNVFSVDTVALNGCYLPLRAFLFNLQFKIWVTFKSWGKLP